MGGGAGAMEENRFLQNSELRYRRLIEAVRDGILILNAKTGTIEDANPFMTELLGYSHEQLLGKELWEISVFKDIENSRAAFRRLQQDGVIGMRTCRSRAGTGYGARSNSSVISTRRTVVK
jgi:PAS domain S-box-containing protein